jgi:hypothetical protein
MIAEAIAIKPLRMSLGASSYLETDRFQKGYVYLEVSSYPEASASSPMNGCVRKKIFRPSQALDVRFDRLGNGGGGIRCLSCRRTAAMALADDHPHCLQRSTAFSLAIWKAPHAPRPIGFWPHALQLTNLVAVVTVRGGVRWMPTSVVRRRIPTVVTDMNCWKAGSGQTLQSDGRCLCIAKVNP